MSDWSRRATLGIFVGAVAVAAVTWFRLTLAPIAGSDMALIFYISAVLLAAGIGGATAGIPTTLLSLLAGILFIIGPHSLSESATEWIRVTVFTVEGVAISLTVEQLQRRTKTLRTTALELDAERQIVERMALEDVMTGLGNRRAFERDLERSLVRCARDGAPLTVAIADVDGLKRVNDELGHTKGDALLVAVAAALRGSCRASDEAYRLGGDEFALLLQGADRENYSVLGARLGGLLAEVSAAFRGTGVSIGAAHAPGDGDEASALVRLADSRMYEAKASSQAGPSHPTTGST
jgi:diguanylate cyclase (GGDEF)-like protein